MDTRLGCKRDARKALKGELPYVGGGAYRSVFASPDRKVVYKVCDEDNGDDWANNAELETFAHCRDRGDVSMLAPVTAWVVDGESTKWEWHYVASNTSCDVDGCPRFGHHTLYGEDHQVAVVTPAKRLVLAMPFIPTSGRQLGSIGCEAYIEAKTKVNEFAARNGIIDMHDENWRVADDGTAYITDYAGF